MTRLFNKGGDGAGEIVRVLGLIDNDLDFTKWEPILPLGIRDLQAIIGTEYFTGAQDLNGRLLALHNVYLTCRGLGSKQKFRRQVEGILHG